MPTWMILAYQSVRHGVPARYDIGVFVNGRFIKYREYQNLLSAIKICKKLNRKHPDIIDYFINRGAPPPRQLPWMRRRNNEKD